MNDIILSEQKRKLPILKNGSDSNLGLVTIGSTKFSITNTCPMDSIFQIFLAAVTDNMKILEFCKKNKMTTPLFQMVLSVAEGKIQLRTYQQRIELYLDYWKESPIPRSIQAINGTCNVVSLANFLFKNCVSFEEKSTCQAGCRPRKKYLPSITITDREIGEPLDKVLVDHLLLPGIECQADHCSGKEVNEIQRIGNYVIHLECNVFNTSL